MSLDVIRSLIPKIPAHVLGHRLAKVLETASAEELAELDAILPIWVPNAPRPDGTPNPQALALASPADTLFYGGQAGGGKSALVNGAAMTQHRRSLILRRELTQAGDMIAEARAAAGASGRYNGTYHQLYVHRRGEPTRFIQWAGIPNEDDKNRFKGRAHDLKAFDEVTEFTHSQFTFIIAWNRTTVPGQRSRVIATGNPPTHQDGFWVIDYWAPWLDEHHPDFPATPGELRWYVTIDGKDTEVDGPAMILHKGERLYPKSRTFIPATLADNPILEATGYRSQLQSLPEPLRSQLLHGDFRIGMDDHAFQLIPTNWLRLAMERGKHLAKPDIRMTHLGVDVSRGGKDQTVLTPRYGWWIGEPCVIPRLTTQDGPAVAAKVLEKLERGAIVTIDAEGVGSSPFDSLRMAGPKVPVVPVVFSEGAPAAFDGKPATDRSGLLRFANMRAYCYWQLREALNPDTEKNPHPLALPDDRELFGDLSAPRYGTRNGALIIELKDKIRERIGRSPDKGDSLAVTFAIDEPVTLSSSSLRVGQSEMGEIDDCSWADA